MRRVKVLTLAIWPFAGIFTNRKAPCTTTTFGATLTAVAAAELRASPVLTTSARYSPSDTVGEMRRSSPTNL